VQYSVRSLTREIRQEKQKRDRIGKKEVKLPLFIGDMIQYFKDPQDSIKTLLDLINIFNKIAG
jgi:hypothetical protein